MKTWWHNISGEAGSWLRLKSLSKHLGIELMEHTLTNNHGVFIIHDELLTVLRNRVCPFVATSLGFKQPFAIYARVVRLALACIRHFGAQLQQHIGTLMLQLIKVLVRTFLSRCLYTCLYPCLYTCRCTCLCTCPYTCLYRCPFPRLFRSLYMCLYTCPIYMSRYRYSRPIASRCGSVLSCARCLCSCAVLRCICMDMCLDMSAVPCSGGIRAEISVFELRCEGLDQGFWLPREHCRPYPAELPRLGRADIFSQ